jgi:hypothetical protein
MPPVSDLQRADLRGITAAAGLDIADHHMAILEPAGPPIRVDRHLLEDERARMHVGHGALPLDACRFIIGWWRSIVLPRHPHRRSSPRTIAHVSLPMSYVLSLKVARAGGFHKARGCPTAGPSRPAELPSGHGHQGTDRGAYGRGSTTRVSKSRPSTLFGAAFVIELDGEGVFEALHALL